MDSNGTTYMTQRPSRPAIQGFDKGLWRRVTREQIAAILLCAHGLASGIDHAIMNPRCNLLTQYGDFHAECNRCQGRGSEANRCALTGHQLLRYQHHRDVPRRQRVGDRIIKMVY